MKLSIPRQRLTALIVGLCLAPGVKLAAQGNGSLKHLNFEKAESKLAADMLVASNMELTRKLETAEAALISLQKNFGSISSEAEVFRRKASELRVRLEALGTGKLDDRLLKLLGELKTLGDEKARMRDALICLYEGIRQYEKKSVSSDPVSRLELEVAMRESAKALGIAPAESIDAAPLPSTLTDGMVVSVKEDLALIVANIGSRHGVKTGMTFEVIRNQTVIGAVRMVDVRDRIAGALIQNLGDKEAVKVGDRLKVSARQ